MFPLTSNTPAITDTWECKGADPPKWPNPADAQSFAIGLRIVPPPPIPFYRHYRATGADHFYTTSKNESDQAPGKGWAQEGVCCKLLPTQNPGSVPLYRTYHAAGIDHFYTTNAAERDNAVRNLGYVDEGIAGYVFSTQQPGTIPLHRLYHQAGRDHFYTTDAAEKQRAITQIGYIDEGIAGYVYPAQSPKK